MLSLLTIIDFLGKDSVDYEGHRLMDNVALYSCARVKPHTPEYLHFLMQNQVLNTELDSSYRHHNNTPTRSPHSKSLGFGNSFNVFG